MMRGMVLSLLLATAILGCGPSTTAPSATAAPEAAATKVAFVTNNASDFWTIARKGTEKAARDFGVEVVFRIPSAGTAEQQMQIVQDLVTLGVSGIAISPKDPSNQTEILNEIAAKVNLITQDSDAPESQRMCYIGTDNYEAGRQAGQLIQEAVPNGSKIMAFVGTMDAQNARDRLQGIKDVLAATGHVIVDVRTDETDRAKAVSNVEDALNANPDLACLVGLWSYNGPAIVNGVKSVGRPVKIVCFDEEQETLQGIVDGHIFGTIVQQPYQFGYQSVKLLKELAGGNRSSVPERKQIFVPTLRITKENVDEFWNNLREMVK